jgi:hypothetical protein
MYNLNQCNDLIEKYVNYGGYATTVREGILGLGTLVLHGAAGKKSIVINEVYLNANSSGHTIRMYNKLPKKYQKLIKEIV